MAEGNVYIEGIDPSIPGWATETTMAQIRQILATISGNSAETSTALDKIYTSESGDAQKQYKILHDTLGAVRTQSQETAKATQKEQQESAKNTIHQNKIAGFFETLIRQNETQANILKTTAERQRELAINKNITAQGGDMTDATTRELAGMKYDEEALAERFKEAGKVVSRAAVGILATTKAINSFMGQQTEDRFNMAQEIRQSGLMAGLSDVESGLTSMSKMIHENNFTLGEAAEFTKQFSRSVGIVGVKSSLEFASSLQKARSEGGLAMTAEFGLEFGEITSLAGEYLDSLRNMGVLDRMSQQQLRDGMDDFMSGVSSTANVLKINLEDAAKMISQTLQRDDVTSRLVTMDPNRANAIRETIGSAGMLEGTLGQAVIERMAAGSQGAFVREQSFQQLSGTGIGKELLPIVERLAMAGEQGPEAFQTAIADLSPDIQGIIASASQEGKRAVLQTDQFLQSMIADLSRLRATVEDADKGPTGPSEADKAVLEGIDTRRQAVVALEQVLDEQVKGFTSILGEQNTANKALLAEAVEFANTFSPLASTVTLLTGKFDVAVTDLQTSLLSAGTSIVDWANKIVGAEVSESQTDSSNETRDIQKATDSTLETGREVLNQNDLTKDDRNIIKRVFTDTDAENMFDKINSILLTEGPNKSEDIADDLKDLTKLLGLFKPGEEYGETQAAQLRAVMEAIGTTDASKTEEGQENMRLMIQALENLETKYTSINPGSYFGRDNVENAAEKDAVLIELRNLVNALNNN